MLSLARTSLSLSRIFIRTSFLKFNYKKINPIGTNIAKNIIFASLYSQHTKKRFKFKFDESLTAAALKRIGEKKGENIPETSIVEENPKEYATTIMEDSKKDVTSVMEEDSKKDVTSIMEECPKEEKIDEKETVQKIEESTSKESDQQISVPSSMNPAIIATVTQTESTKGEDGTSKEEEDASWQTMKYTFTIFGFTFTAIGMFLLMEFGRPGVDENGDVIEDEFSNMSQPMQYIYRTIKQMNYYKKMINEPSRDKLLPDELKYPYHQPPYTLVLEFKDVIVHPDWTYQTGWRFKKRPGLDQFLEMLNGIYEIVIYTAELGMTVFPLLEAVDPNNLITYKLVRDATNFVDGHHVKDLDKLNRSLTKVIAVDWDDDNIQYNKENVLRIKRWNGDDHDTTLIDLANFLRVIAMSDIQDVRDVLRYYSEFDDPIETFREKQRELERTMYSSK